MLWQTTISLKVIIVFQVRGQPMNKILKALSAFEYYRWVIYIRGFSSGLKDMIADFIFTSSHVFLHIFHSRTRSAVPCRVNILLYTDKKILRLAKFCNTFKREWETFFIIKLSSLSKPKLQILLNEGSKKVLNSN